MGADSVKFGARNVSFGMLVAPNLAPWGPSSDAGGLGSTRKETLGLNLGVWGSRIKYLVRKVLPKPAFHICRDYVDFGVIFTWFSMALGPIFRTFGGLGAGLKHYDFRWFSRGSRS